MMHSQKNIKLTYIVSVSFANLGVTHDICL